MFRIKICGVTNVPDAITAVDAGADAIGLNFYEMSKRCVPVSDGKKICGRVADQVLRVGVFVNPEWSAATKIRFEVGLDAIQLHGDERPSEVARFAKERDEEVFSSQIEVAARFMPQSQLEDLHAAMRQLRAKVIWARRVDSRGLRPICQDLEECKSLGAASIALLLDAAAPGTYGGTGLTAPWLDIAECSLSFGDTPLILAGGLSPDNVAEAIRIVRPHGVDVASGVESAPGKKDPHKVRDFIAAARAAFDALDPPHAS